MKQIAFRMVVCASILPWANLAHASYEEPRSDDLRVSRYLDDEDPSVASRLGCVKMCDNDQFPCDPWSFKKLDGRCSG